MPRVEAEVISKDTKPYFLKAEKKNTKGTPTILPFDVEEGGTTGAVFGSIGSFEMDSWGGCVHLVASWLDKRTKVLDKEGRTLEPTRTYTLGTGDDYHLGEVTFVNRRARQIVKLRVKADPETELPVGVKPDGDDPTLSAAIALEQPKQNP